MRKAEVQIGQEYLADTGYGYMKVGVALEHGWGTRGYSWRSELDRARGNGVLMAFPTLRTRYDEDGEPVAREWSPEFRVVQLNMISRPMTLEEKATDDWLDAERKHRSAVTQRNETAYRESMRERVQAALAEYGANVYVSAYEREVKVPFRTLVEMLGLEDGE